MYRSLVLTTVLASRQSPLSGMSCAIAALIVELGHDFTLVKSELIDSGSA
jgi:hypothetical protein